MVNSICIYEEPMLSWADVSAFGDLFRLHIERQFQTQTAFASAAKESVQTINNVVKGQRHPNLDNVAKWAKVLKLSDKDREEFILMARLEHAPIEIRDAFLQLRRDQERSRQREEESRREHDELRRLANEALRRRIAEDKRPYSDPDQKPD